MDPCITRQASSFPLISAFFFRHFNSPRHTHQSDLARCQTHGAATWQMVNGRYDIITAFLSYHAIQNHLFWLCWPMKLLNQNIFIYLTCIVYIFCNSTLISYQELYKYVSSFLLCSFSIHLGSLSA